MQTKDTSLELRSPERALCGLEEVPFYVISWESLQVNAEGTWHGE